MEDTTQLTPPEVSHPDSSVANASNYYNNSKEEYEFPMTLLKSIDILSLVICIIALLLGVIGNGLVIFITGFRMKKTVNTVWFLNLAIADFTFTFTCLILNIVPLALGSHWPFGEAMCKVSTTMVFINLYASVYLLLVISIDRWISVFAPVWAQNHRNPRYASFVAFGVWILALLLSSPVFHFMKTNKSVWNEAVIHCNYNYSHDEKQARFTYHTMVIIHFIFSFVIPFLVIIICYGAILLRLRRKCLARSRKPFKVITAVIVAFFICWFPVHVFSFLEIQRYEDPKLHLVLIIGILLTSSLPYINSCLNPILYVFMGHDFKERLKSSFPAVLERAFAEEESQSTTQTKATSSKDLDSQDL